jgi:hypothetical protein
MSGQYQKCGLGTRHTYDTLGGQLRSLKFLGANAIYTGRQYEQAGAILVLSSFCIPPYSSPNAEPLAYSSQLFSTSICKYEILLWLAHLREVDRKSASYHRFFASRVSSGVRISNIGVALSLVPRIVKHIVQSGATRKVGREDPYPHTKSTS